MNKSIFLEKLENINSFDDCKKMAQTLISLNKCHFFEVQHGENSNQKQAHFKRYMAEKFSVPVNNIQITGSAWFGYSLNPNNNFRDFNDESDIDIVIISEKIFQSFWDILFDKFLNIQHIENFRKIHSSIFKRHINTVSSHKFLSSYAYDKWLRKTEGYQKDLQLDFNFPSKIGYRIYRSWDDYEKVLALNLNVLSDKIKKEKENEN